MNDTFMDDTELAGQIAEHAGRLLMDLRHSGLLTDKPLGKLGDELANLFIMRALRAHRPDDAILSEEEKDSAARLSAQRVWIIDPLDGTREYSEGRADWAVHVALAIDGVATLGAVSLPGLPLTFTSDVAHPRPRHTGKLRIVVSRTRPAAEAVAVAEALGAELVPMGSAGVKATAVLRGQVDAYVHAGGQYEWDSAAPVGVAAAAGCHCSRLDGSRLVYNRPDPYLPDLLVCRPEVTATVLAAIRQAPDG